MQKSRNASKLIAEFTLDGLEEGEKVGLVVGSEVLLSPLKGAFGFSVGK